MTGTILGLFFGLFLLFLVGQALWGPLRWVLGLALRLVLGGVALLLLNLCTAAWGWQLGVNPLSALTVGMLGFPGLVLLGLLKYFHP